MACVIDHIVIGAAELEAGRAWMTERLGVPPIAAGKHPLMSTHNALWRCGDVYLEVITIDPAAPLPKLKRWYGLDDPQVQARLAEGPALLTWVVEADDLEVAQRALPSATGPALKVTRDALSWRLTVPKDGKLCTGGAQPTLISWDAGSTSPRESLPPQPLELREVSLPVETRVRAALAGLGLTKRLTDGPFAVTVVNARGDDVTFT